MLMSKGQVPGGMPCSISAGRAGGPWGGCMREKAKLMIGDVDEDGKVSQAGQVRFPFLSSVAWSQQLPNRLSRPAQGRLGRWELRF